MPGPHDENVPILHAARRQALLECGELIGTMNILVKETQQVQTIAFHCTGPKLHRGECAFVGEHMVVQRRQR